MSNIPSLVSRVLNKAKSIFMGEMDADQLVGNAMAGGNQGNKTNPVPGNTGGDPPEPAVKITFMKAVTAIFNGMGIGLLLGMLLGLSISPVVSGVIATLSSLLAVFLGLNEKLLDPLKSLRIGAFGLFAVVGILIGLYMRANDPFTPTLLEKKNEYVALGYSEAEARNFITGAILADTGKARREANVLYSSSVDISSCDVLYYASADQPVEELVNTFKQAGGTWEELADAYQADFPSNIVGKALIAMRDSFCGLTEAKEVKMINLEEISKLNEGSTLEQIETVLVSDASGENWKSIVDHVRELLPQADRKKVYLTTIKVLSHD